VGVQKFEDLIAWQKARELAREVYQVSRKDAFARDFGLSSQLQRAVVSIMSNIAEGYERSNPREFHHFLVIAKASCAEVRSQHLAMDIGYLNQEEFALLHRLAEEVGRIIGGLRAAVEKKGKLQ
jgi:four helix bundle protein